MSFISGGIKFQSYKKSERIKLTHLKKIVHYFLLLFFCFFNRSGACTNFCMDTPNGPVFGCNLDLFIPGDGLVFINRRHIVKKGFDPGTTGKIAEWTSKYGSVTFNLGGREWAFGGMNEAGLVLGTMEVLTSKFPEPDERPPLPIGPWAQYILDTCGSIEDVIETVKKVRIEDPAPPVHFLIADAEGNCAVVEWVEGELVCYTGKTLSVKALTNSLYHKALAVYEHGGPRWWQPDRGQTNKRFTKAAYRNKGYKKSGEKNAIKYAFETLTHVVAAAHTKWNIVYDISQRQIYFRSFASPTLKYLSMDHFDFSCSAPLLMLDINAALEGNVEKNFVPYDHDVNLTVFQTLCARYQIDIATETVEGIIRHIESYECAH